MHTFPLFFVSLNSVQRDEDESGVSSGLRAPFPSSWITQFQVRLARFVVHHAVMVQHRDRLPWKSKDPSRTVASTPSRDHPPALKPFPFTGSQDLKVDGETETAEEQEKKQIFTYFKGLSKKQLREIGRHWMWKSNGNKDDYIYRNYRFVIFKKTMGRDLQSLIANDPKCPDFDNAMRTIEAASLDLITPPSEAELDARLSELGDPPEGSGFQVQSSVSTPGATTNLKDANVSTPEFCVSEFARLIAILREDPAARNAISSLDKN